MSVALAAQAARHTALGVLGRGDVQAAANRLRCPALRWDEPLPPADLVMVAVRDDAIGEVARKLRPPTRGIAMHLSGMASVSALAPLAAEGASIAAFHPLQTLPDPDRGAGALTGAFVAITTTDADVSGWLSDFADSLGARPFALADEQKPLYHAAAAASSNYVVTVLALAFELFRGAGVDPQAARPLVEAVVENVFDVGPAAALTGPIARGDVGTVAAQRSALATLGEDPARRFLTLARLTAELAGTTEVMAAAFEDRA